MRVLIVRLVLCALLSVNFAWAVDVHPPGVGGSSTAELAVGNADHDHHDAGQDHCFHCYGGNVAQPTLDSRGAGPLPSAAPLLAALNPDRPPARSAAPPERPPRR